MLVKKANGKWRMCVNFTDYIQLALKITIPFLQLIGWWIQQPNNGIYSLIDTISGYHQIMMGELDIEKIAFITNHGVFCYKVIGLKNAKATYWHLVNRLFKELISKTIEVYIDDMMIKN